MILIIKVNPVVLISDRNTINLKIKLRIEMYLELPYYDQF